MKMVKGGEAYKKVKKYKKNRESLKERYNSIICKMDMKMLKE